MHKAVLMIVESDSRENAIERVQDFMEDHLNQVFDWYQIGGRWNNLLAPREKAKEFDKWVKEEYADFFNEYGYKYNDMTKAEIRESLQSKWEDLGLKSKNPYYDGYAFSINGASEEDGYYNAVPLKDCLDVVKDWQVDLKAKAKEAFESLVEERIKELQGGRGTMSAYYANIYSDAVYGNFNFESNVFYVDDFAGEQIPDEIEKHWVVVIDMHN